MALKPHPKSMGFEELVARANAYYVVEDPTPRPQRPKVSKRVAALLRLVEKLPESERDKLAEKMR